MDLAGINLAGINFSDLAITCTTVDVNKMFTKSFTEHVSISDQ